MKNTDRVIKLIESTTKFLNDNAIKCWLMLHDPEQNAIDLNAKTQWLLAFGWENSAPFLEYIDVHDKDSDHSGSLGYIISNLTVSDGKIIKDCINEFLATRSFDYGVILTWIQNLYRQGKLSLIDFINYDLEPDNEDAEEFIQSRALLHLLDRL